MKCSFQVISKKYGVRSKVCVSDRAEFAKQLRQFTLTSAPLDYVLALAEHNAAGDLEWSTAPLMTVRTFCAEYDPTPEDKAEKEKALIEEYKDKTCEEIADGIKETVENVTKHRKGKE